MSRDFKFKSSKKLFQQPSDISYTRIPCLAKTLVSSQVGNSSNMLNPNQLQSILDPYNLGLALDPSHNNKT